MSSETMPECSQPSALLPPGPIGRAARFLMGVVQVYFVYIVIANPGIVSSPNAPTNTMYWVGVGLAFALLSWTVNLAFDLKWGKWPSLTAVAIALLAAGLNFGLYGTFWGVPLGLVVTVVAVYVHGHMGVSHLLAAIIATPGCEMKSIPHLAAIARGSESACASCPGVWKPLDRFEARLWGKK